MSFDFALDGALPPGRIARAPRRRAAPAPVSEAAVPQQLPLAPSGAPARPRAIVAPRTPVATPAPVQTGANGVARDGRRWSEDGWTVRVVSNEDEDGWAVEALRDGESEPVLVAPWSTERDGRAPRPLDRSAFNALVKSASEILQQHRRQLQARLHRRLTVSARDAQWEVTLDVVPDEFEPYALLAAFDESGERVAQEKVMADFKLTPAAARTWIEGDFR